MIRHLSWAFLLVAVLAVAGCTGSTPNAGASPVTATDGNPSADPTDDSGGGGTGPGVVGGGGAVTAVGPGISIDEAIASTSAEPLLINGALLVQGNEVRLCSALAESLPPQCAGSSLVVQGLDLDSIAGLKSAQGVSWVDGQIQILGTVDDGVLTVAQTEL